MYWNLRVCHYSNFLPNDIYSSQSGEGRGLSEKICVLNIPAHQLLSDMLEFISPVL